MDPQIVFIHNEKTAGTSLRALLDRVYGRDQVVWRARDLKARQGKSFANLTGCRVVGGHLTISDFDSAKREMLFLSVVREPISRAVSLFHYFAEHAPDKDRRMWKWKGLRPDSMLATIENAAPFRRAISNRQCYRLSGGDDFQAVRETLESKNVLVGAFEHLEAFVNRVSALLDWPDLPMGRHNRAPRERYEAEILAEPGLADAISALNREDERLHEFVRQREFFENIVDQRVVRCLRGYAENRNA